MELRADIKNLKNAAGPTRTRVLSAGLLVRFAMSLILERIQ